MSCIPSIAMYVVYPSVYFTSLLFIPVLTTTKGRTDKYMYGLPTGQKFRSANEFLPHIFWLSRIKNRGFFMKTEQDSDYDVPTPEDIGNLTCGCAYCGGKPRSSSSNATRVQRITRKHYD